MNTLLLTANILSILVNIVYQNEHAQNMDINNGNMKSKKKAESVDNISSRVEVGTLEVSAIPTSPETGGQIYNGSLDITLSTFDERNDHHLPAGDADENTRFVTGSRPGIQQTTTAALTITGVGKCRYGKSRTYVYQCPESYCQHVSHTCETRCLQEDEGVNCELQSCTGSYHCPSGDKVLMSEVCDGIKQCSDGDDELRCTHSCPSHCQCAGLTIRCSTDQIPPNHAPFSVDWHDIASHVQPDFSYFTYLAVEDCSLGPLLMPSLTNISTQLETFLGKLTNLYSLNLSGSAISDLPDAVFRRLTDISALYLHRNMLTSIPDNIFRGLTKLRRIHLSENKISFLSENVFRGLTRIRYLYLDNNLLSSLPDNVFRGLSTLVGLSLSDNKISFLSGKVFRGLSQLAYLYLHNNSLSTIPDNIFRGLTSMEGITLANNTISFLSDDLFQGLTRLGTIFLMGNKISHLPNNVFSGLKSLSEIQLGHNNMLALPQSVFRRLHNVVSIRLNTNKISTLPDNVFQGLTTLRHIDLSSNRLLTLPRNIFHDLQNLQMLLLSDNMLTILPYDTFLGLGRLRTLDIMRNKIEVQERMFNGLGNLSILSTDSYLVCCVRPTSVAEDRCLATDDAIGCHFGFSNVQCKANSDAISSCLTLIRIEVLRISLWIIGLCAFLGNAFVIFYRLISDRDNIRKSHSIFILNLGVSDMLMGVYLLIIGSVDVAYHGQYAWNAQKWTRSLLCTRAGILSTISSEMSTFLILVVTIDRFIVIVYPFSMRRITWRMAVYMSVILWLLSFAIAVTPNVFLQSYFKGEFYSQSGVCLALPITSEQRPGTEYSFAIFVVLNSVIFLMILSGQICIFRSLRSSGRVASSQTRRREMAVARTLFFVVATDFSCWFPIGVMGVMSQCGVHIPDDVYAWVMVFVLPINSAVNPLLYTGSYLWRRRNK